jgi:ribonuclease P protein component
MSSLVGHVLRSADFTRLLQRPSSARSPLFSAHHLDSTPTRDDAGSGKRAATQSGAREYNATDSRTTEQGYWLGFVLPKRLARRAVTRNLIRRLGRATFQESLCSSTPVAPGLWALRLRGPVDTSRFVSAKSNALRRALRDELDTLWKRSPRAKPTTPNQLLAKASCLLP